MRRRDRTTRDIAPSQQRSYHLECCRRVRGDLDLVAPSGRADGVIERRAAGEGGAKEGGAAGRAKEGLHCVHVARECREVQRRATAPIRRVHVCAARAQGAAHGRVTGLSGQMERRTTTPLGLLESCASTVRTERLRRL